MDLTELTQDRDRWRELVHAVMNQSFISPTNAHGHTTEQFNNSVY